MLLKLRLSNKQKCRFCETRTLKTQMTNGSCWSCAEANFEWLREMGVVLCWPPFTPKVKALTSLKGGKQNAN